MLRRFLLWVLREDLPTATRLLELEQEWETLVTKLAAAVARESKAKKRAVTKALDGETQRPPPTRQPASRKDALRQRAAVARGLKVMGGGTIPEGSASDEPSGQE